MLRYLTVALALKLFSSCSPMKHLYRNLGNTFGNKKRLRSDIPNYYIERINRMLSLCKQYEIIRNGDKLIEVGTGWIHWEAITIKLFFDIEAILFDVWDNRQFGALKKYLTDLSRAIGKEITVQPVQVGRTNNLLREILATNSFEDLYRLLGFKYVIVSNGKFNEFKDESFDVIVSAGVLDHIRKQQLPDTIKDFQRLLKPSGYSMHSINLGDHLYPYDKSVSTKNYLKFSDKVWRFCFENEVQYFNRVQRSEWLKLFDKSGLKQINEESTYTNIGPIKIHKKYRYFDRRDLECFSLNILHRKAPFC